MHLREKEETEDNIGMRQSKNNAQDIPTFCSNRKAGTHQDYASLCTRQVRALQANHFSLKTTQDANPVRGLPANGP